ncbi:MAG: Holliday junction branch migration protein RuvA [Alphaproteobacteria bacterium]|nr:Holliday junction branch migration protein RuvA [Alphaproteobacteria bacterium]
MIAKLRGNLDSVGDGFLILDVNGVGYRLFCSGRTLSKMPPTGGAAALLTEMQVREDSIKLFGFADEAEKSWFALLTTVQGVGAKVALAILSALSPENLSLAIASGDSKAVSRANGVGPKLAVRIVTELKGKIGALSSLTDGDMSIDVAAGHMASGGAADDVISALINMGYARMDAVSAVSKAMKTLGAEAGFADLIREALKGFAK